MESTLTAILDAASQRDLPSLLIGGNAIILLGFARNTIDLDLLVPVAQRSAWLDLMRELRFRHYHGTDAFAQFEPGAQGMVSVDLMFVDDNTWSRLATQPVERTIAGHSVKIPSLEHLVALKLHAASSPGRARQEADWEDIRQLVQIGELDPSNPEFRETILRYSGAAGLRRVESFRK